MPTGIPPSDSRPHKNSNLGSRRSKETPNHSRMRSGRRRIVHVDQFNALIRKIRRNSRSGKASEWHQSPKYGLSPSFIGTERDSQPFPARKRVPSKIRRTTRKTHQTTLIYAENATRRRVYYLRLRFLYAVIAAIRSEKSKRPSNMLNDPGQRSRRV